MMNPLILPITFFIIATVHSANAIICEGHYIANEQIVCDEIVADRSYQVIGNKFLKNIALPGSSFRDICNQCTMGEKLSICMKVLQHRWHALKPTSFTVDSTESDFTCKPFWFTGKHKMVYRQRMYTCPTTIMTYMGIDNSEISLTEKPFLISQGLHEKQYRVHFFDGGSEQSPASVLGQLTGFRLEKLKFTKIRDKLYTFRPSYENSGAVGSASQVVLFRGNGSVDDYFLSWQSVTW